MTSGILLGLKEAAEKGHVSGQNLEKHAAGAKAHIDLIAFMPGVNPRPTAPMSFSASCEARVSLTGFIGTAEAVP